MQDNQHFDQEFTDRAWTDMRALLDKEMPERGVIPPTARGKGGRYLLPLLLLLLLTAGIGWLYFGEGLGMAEQEATPSEMTMTPAANADVSDAVADPSTVESSAERTDRVAAGEEATPSATSHTTAAATTAKMQVIVPVSSLADKTTISNNEKNQPAPLDFKALDIVNPASEKAEAKPAPDKTDVTDGQPQEIMPTKKEVKTTAPIAFLQSRSVTLPLTSEAETEKPTLSTGIADPNTKTRLHLYAATGVRSENFDLPATGLLGAEVALRRPTKKLELHTGIYYLRQSDFFLSEDVPQAEFSSADIPDETIGATVPELQRELMRLAATRQVYHWLEAAPAVRYRVSPKWSLQTGLAAKFLLLQKDETVLPFSSEGDVAPVSVFENQTSSSLRPQTTNVSLLFGVGYEVCDRFDLGFTFRQGLQDTYPTLEGKSRAASLELKAAFRLR